jgi:hypothetical protein
MQRKPMNHLDDTILNEYLDSTLSPSHSAEVETHLAACPECAAGLAALRAVFVSLSAMPELALERNLAPAILAAIQKKPAPSHRAAAPQQPHPLLKFAFASQAILTLLALILATQLIPSDLLTSNIQYPILNIQSLISTQSVQFPITNYQFPIINLQSPISNYQLPLLALAALLFIVGNGVLLRPTLKAKHG